MKKAFLIAGLILLLVFSYTYVSYAAEGVKTTTTKATVTKAAATSSDPDQSQNVVGRHPVGNKAARGVKNVLFGWTEVPKRVVDITKETRNPLWGLFAGVFQGTGKAFARTASGACDVVTAPVRPNDKPFIQPDMANE